MTTVTCPDCGAEILVQSVQCAKCGATVTAYTIAPAGSRYAGRPICVACVDAPRQRKPWGPQEFKSKGGQ